MEEALKMEQDHITDMPECKWSCWVEPTEFILPYGEQPDTIFHWKNDPIANAKMERYLRGGSSS